MRGCHCLELFADAARVFRIHSIVCVELGTRSAALMDNCTEMR